VGSDAGNVDAIRRAQDPLAAVPLAAPDTHAEPLPEIGGLLLRREELPRGRLWAWLRARIGWRRERRFELDAVGARFWRAIDGERSLSDIHQILCESFALDRNEARRAVVEFTTALMRRGLLALRVDPSRNGRSTETGAASEPGEP
jgi:hypothetical protein